MTNPFRVILTASAYRLFQHLRWNSRRTVPTRTQVERVRTMPLEGRARSTQSVRRGVLHRPTSYAFTDVFCRAALRVGGRSARAVT